jgi:DNA-binding transcriptional regulator YdaS (Cro superfamily)
MNLKTYISNESGRASALARAVGVPPQSVYDWTTDRQVPLSRCVDIEKATFGEVTCEELRPDMRDYFAYLRGLTAETERA